MNKVFLLPVLFAAGCAMHPKMPLEVAYMPNDCANAAAIDRWLQASARTPKTLIETQEEYEAKISAIKNRLWTFRADCQR